MKSVLWLQRFPGICVTRSIWWMRPAFPPGAARLADELSERAQHSDSLMGMQALFTKPVLLARLTSEWGCLRTTHQSTCNISSLVSWFCNPVFSAELWVTPNAKHWHDRPQIINKKGETKHGKWVKPMNLRFCALALCAYSKHRANTTDNMMANKSTQRSHQTRLCKRKQWRSEKRGDQSHDFEPYSWMKLRSEWSQGKLVLLQCHSTRLSEKANFILESLSFWGWFVSVFLFSFPLDALSVLQQNNTDYNNNKNNENTI